MSRRRARSLFAPALLMMAAGCAFDIDENPNLLPEPRPPQADMAPPDSGPGSDAEMGAGPADACVPPAETCDCVHVGDWFRFTSLAPTKLGGDPRHPLVLTLRNLWARDIERFELNVIFVVSAVDGDRISLRVMNAARGELGSGEICQLPETAVTLDFVRDPCDPCTVRMERPQRINIYAGTPEIPRNCAPRLDVLHAIPVTRIQLQARISPDCSELSEGFAENAGIPAAALPEICTCPGLSGPAEDCEPIDPAFNNGSCNGCNENFQNLQELMVALNGGQPIATECPDEDGAPGVCIDAAFNGARWPMGEPPECPPDRVSLP